MYFYKIESMTLASICFIVGDIQSRLNYHLHCKFGVAVHRVREFVIYTLKYEINVNVPLPLWSVSFSLLIH